MAVTTTTVAPTPNPLMTKLVTRAKNADDTPLYPEYMPFYDPLEKVEDVGEFEHDDPGHRADPSFPNLLSKATKVENLSPHVGTEIEGVQLSQLSKEGLDELALLAAQRGALVFRKQDFGDIGFQKQKEVVRHFGPLHVHGWAPHPVGGSSEHMVIYDHKE
jgi:sulfonate dioxygenase